MHMYSTWIGCLAIWLLGTFLIEYNTVLPSDRSWKELPREAVRSSRRSVPSSSSFGSSQVGRILISINQIKIDQLFWLIPLSIHVVWQIYLFQAMCNFYQGTHTGGPCFEKEARRGFASVCKFIEVFLFYREE